MSDGDKKNYDSNYFWSIIVDSIDVFDSAYKVWFCCMLHDVTVDIFLNAFCLKGKYSRTFWILYQWIEPDFHSWAVEITEPRPDMKIKVATFTVPKKSYNI